jgi:hypothetical protein
MANTNMNNNNSMVAYPTQAINSVLDIINTLDLKGINNIMGISNIVNILTNPYKESTINDITSNNVETNDDTTTKENNDK